MIYRKKRPDGVLEREKVLQSVYPLSKEIIEYSRRSYNRKDLSKDDVLDALAAAITAKLGFNRFFTIPEKPPIDSNGLRMEMVYFIPEKWNWGSGGKKRASVSSIKKLADLLSHSVIWSFGHWVIGSLKAQSLMFPYSLTEFFSQLI